MKTIICAILFTIGITGIATAQHASFGVKGGLNIYNMHNSNGTYYNPLAGVHVGGLSHIHITDHWAVQPELVFSTQGAKFRNAGTETRYNLSYVNVPVLAQYMFNNGFRVQAGPQIGFLVHASSRNNELKQHMMDDYNKVDLAFTGGASYQIPNSGFGLDARFNIGVTDISKNSAVNTTNRGFQAGVFYLFKNQ
jgi:Outer membrane protein beta-barrel domain